MKDGNGSTSARYIMVCTQSSRESPDLGARHNTIACVPEVGRSGHFRGCEHTTLFRKEPFKASLYVASMLCHFLFVHCTNQEGEHGAYQQQEYIQKIN